MSWRERISEDIIAKAAWNVTSADKAYSWLREQGYTFTRADVREAWKDYNERTLYEGPINQWDQTKKIPKAWIVTRETKEESGYMHMFRIRFWDPYKKEEIERGWAIVLDEPNPFANVISELEPDIQLYAEEMHGKPIAYRPIGIMRLVPKG